MISPSFPLEYMKNFKLASFIYNNANLSFIVENVEEIRMKKFLAFTMALLLLGVAIVGCIGGESPTSSKNSPTTTQTP